ncbi:MAG TPA: PrsW family glutamic-type intramembrane protease [Planctomycetota bacterium]|nr:PrsW family glutamic-type intramembrane protease [Planctomycetota bacterium]
MPKVTCGCGARLTAPDRLAGRLVRCPKCAGPVFVPAVEPEIDLLPEPASSPVAPEEPSPRIPALRRPVPAPAPPVPAWKLYGRWALGLALLPLVLSVFSKNDAKERFEKMIESDPKLAAQITQLEGRKDAKEEDMFALFPDHRITGAFVARDSKIHWLFALASATAFWGFLLLIYPMGNASHQALWGVGLFTGTVGILLLLGLQLAAGFSQGITLTGHSIVVILFYIIKFIGFSYRAALDPENGFLLSMLGFTFGVGFCEEVCKLLPLLWHYKRTAKLDLSGAVVWGLASGVGFGVSEGITYSTDHYNGVSTGGIYVVRFVSCVALHAIWNGFSAVLLWRWQAELDAIERWWDWFIPLFKIAGVSMVLHALYDTSLKKENETLALLTAAVSFAAFFWLYERMKKDEPALTGVRPA